MLLKIIGRPVWARAVRLTASRDCNIGASGKTVMFTDNAVLVPPAASVAVIACAACVTASSGVPKMAQVFARAIRLSPDGSGLLPGSTAQLTSSLPA